MIGRHGKFFIVVITLCVLLVVSIMFATMFVVNELNTSGSSSILTLDEAIEMLEKKLDKNFGCVEKKNCNLYSIDVIVVITPIRDGYYNVYICTNGLNYTRGSAYSDTVIWRVELAHLSHHISMISYGVLSGYREWLGIEKKLKIHLDVGYGIYNESKDTLLVHVDLPTFKFCETSHACGEFYTNTTLYIDNEKYIIWQYMKLNFSYLIDKGYIRLKEVKNNYAYPVNPPAILRFTYVESPFWRIPISFIKDNTELPIIVVLHMVTTKHSILEKYLNQIGVFKPLIETNLAESYVSEVAHGNLTVFAKLSDEISSKAIRRFLDILRDSVIEKYYPNTSLEVKYVSNPHGGEYYLVKWDNANLMAYIGTLDISIYNVTRKFVETLINPLTNIIKSTTPSCKIISSTNTSIIQCWSTE